MNEAFKKILNLDSVNQIKLVKKVSKKDNQTDKSTDLINASEIGFLLALPITLGALFGLWLDKKFLTEPKMTLSFLFVGIFISFSNLFIIIKQYSKKDKK